MPKAEVFPYPFPGLNCDTYGCTHRANWAIGNPSAPSSTWYRLCNDCIENITEIKTIDEPGKADFSGTQGPMILDCPNPDCGGKLKIENDQEHTVCVACGQDICIPCKKHFRSKQGYVSHHLRIHQGVMSYT